VSAVRGRLHGDSGSMPIAVLLTIVGLGLSAVLATIGATQVRITKNDVPRVEALNAAQTGLDVALGQLRAATTGAGSGSGVGDLSKLPCAGITGAVSAGATATYTVTISYLPEQPTTMDPAWVAARRMTCAPGSGLSALPQYAFLESTGRAGPGLASRKLLATYAFTTVMRARISDGGLIPNMNHHTTVKVCLAAPRAEPVSGDYLIVDKCDATRNEQRFVYEPSLNLVLAYSREQGAPMCLEAPPQAGAYVRFQPCAATPVPRQRWGQNDYSAFQGTTDGVHLNNFCFNVEPPGTLGSRIRLGNAATDPGACYTAWDNRKTFFPGSDVGAGRAGRATNQLVSYEQSSRCIDITADDVDYGFLVIFPCKQVLTGRVLWNQEWMTPPVAAGATSGVGRIWTTSAQDGHTYCLTSPGSTAPRAYVVVRRCPSGSGTPANMTWTYRLDTGFPSTSYRIESSYGVGAGGDNFCLAPTDSSDFWTEEWAAVANISKLVLAPCDGSDRQKWSVSTVLNRGALTKVVEP
jgi:hypothetical protein